MFTPPNQSALILVICGHRLLDRVRQRLLRDHCNLPPPTAYSQKQMSTPTKDRSHWPQAKLGSFDEVRTNRIRQWQEAGCQARLDAAWELVYDYWVGMKEMNPDELRLQRSVTNFRRRGS